MRASRWARTCAGGGWGSGCGWQRSGAWARRELRELHRIGVNLNQMARAMNSGAGAPAGTREAVEQASELVARLLAGEAE